MFVDIALGTDRILYSSTASDVEVEVGAVNMAGGGMVLIGLPPPTELGDRQGSTAQE